jgi:hypothetical protein
MLADIVSCASSTSVTNQGRKQPYFTQWRRICVASALPFAPEEAIPSQWMEYAPGQRDLVNVVRRRKRTRPSGAT